MKQCLLTLPLDHSDVAAVSILDRGANEKLTSKNLYTRFNEYFLLANTIHSLFPA